MSTAADTIDWTLREGRDVACPICATAGMKPFVLSCRPSWHSKLALSLFACPACGCHFFPDLETAHYDSHPDIAGYLKFYIELGAGVDILAAPAFIVPVAKGSRYLEVGCGFGFGLDFARHIGLDVVGVDPSPFADAGRAQLQLPISNEYLTADSDLGSRPFQLAVISEVIEHIVDPVPFIGLIAGQLDADGVLLLTTPFAGSIRKSTSWGALLPLLSPSWHYIIYSEQGITKLLRDAGFKKVVTHVRGHTLLAAATNGDRDIDLKRRVPYEDLCSYLEDRIGKLSGNDHLRQGLVYRLIKARCNHGDYAGALDAYESLRHDINAIYGIDVALPHQGWLKTSPDEGFREFAARYPMFLCSLGYLRGIIAINHEHDSARAETSFAMALEYGQNLRRRLQDIGADDGETEVHLERSRSLLLRSIAHRSPKTAIDTLLADAPDGGTTPDELWEDNLLDLLGHLSNLGELAEMERIASLAESVLARRGAGRTEEDCRRIIEARRALGSLSVNSRGAFMDAARHYTLALRSTMTWARLAPSAADPSQYASRIRSEQLLSLIRAGQTDHARRVASKLKEPHEKGRLAPDVKAALEKLLQHLNLRR